MYSTLTLIDPPGYTLGKVGVMSAAVQMEKRKEIPINCATTIILPYSLEGRCRDKLLDKRKMKATQVGDKDNIIQMDKMAELIFLWMKGAKRPDNGSFVEFKVDNKFVFPLFV